MIVTLDARHPIWPIIRMAVIGAVACGILNVTASHFDAGEMKAAGAISLMSVIFDVLKRQFTAQG